MHDQFMPVVMMLETEIQKLKDDKWRSQVYYEDAINDLQQQLEQSQTKVKKLREVINNEDKDYLKLQSELEQLREKYNNLQMRNSDCVSDKFVEGGK